MRTYANPSLASKFDWGKHDLEQITVVVNELNRQGNPFLLVEMIAEQIDKWELKERPNLKGLASGLSTDPKILPRVWCFSYLRGSDTPDKSMKTSLKRIMDRCMPPRALFIACAYMEGMADFDLSSYGDSPYTSGGRQTGMTKRRAFFEQCQNQPDMKKVVDFEYAVEEAVLYNVQDLFRNIMQELDK